MDYLCDSRLFSSVVAGRASGKAGVQHIATDSGDMTDDTERGHIETPICSDRIKNIQMNLTRLLTCHVG